MFILSWVAYFGFLVFVHFSTWFNSCGTMAISFSSALIYLNWVIVVGICCLFDFFIYSWNLNFNKSVTNSLIIERKAKGGLETSHDLPSNLEKYSKIYKRMNEYFSYFYIFLNINLFKNLEEIRKKIKSQYQ